MITLEKLYGISLGWSTRTVLCVWDGTEGCLVHLLAEEAVLEYGNRLVTCVRNKCVDLSDKESAEDADTTLVDLFFVNMEWERETKLKIYDGNNTIVTSVAEAPAALLLRKVEVYHDIKVKLEDESED